MAASNKVSFRARNLDANRPLRLYVAEELPDISECAPIARGVQQMPTGMEKEEEMESHLQDAIMAQQASTSGISSNHVIPTPKVWDVDATNYDIIYPPQPPVKQQLMKVQAWLAMEREEAEYDLDSEDEDWLKERTHIVPRDLEKIIEILESQSSECAICQPTTARKVLSAFNEGIIDDVYDYWLSKRQDATTRKSLGFGGLIPRVRNECRKENSAVLNPYVAFRRRAEKMQTRKNRKNDEDSYEKVLKLGHDLRRAVHLFEMVKRREKSKLAMLDLDSDILIERAAQGDFGSVTYNQIMAKYYPDESPADWPPSTSGVRPREPVETPSAPEPLPLREENGVKRKRVARKRPTARAAGTAGGVGTAYDRELPSREWLKRNAEVWNQSPAAFISGMSNVTPAVEVDQSIAAACTANADGRYQFKRRRGCHYRAAVPFKNHGQPRPDRVPAAQRFYAVSLPSTSADAPPVTALVRKRVGRGGRVVLDRIIDTTAGGRVPPRHGYVAGRTSCVIYDPFVLDAVGEGTDASPFARMPDRQQRLAADEEEEEEELHPWRASTRHIRSAHYRGGVGDDDLETDAALEAAWLASSAEAAVDESPPSSASSEDCPSGPSRPPQPTSSASRPASDGPRPGEGGGGGGLSTLAAAPSPSTVHPLAAAPGPLQAPPPSSTKSVVPNGVSKQLGSLSSAYQQQQPVRA